ncbi:hypothetical protein DIPPA_10743 [Diplonema papillatum]|nr:hypothetical protein DIPPA_10743 [Diplonema papillatum]
MAAQRQEEMTNTLDNWLCKYCKQELGYQITDKKHIGYDNISATQDPGSDLWKLDVSGNIAGGGPKFKGTFTMKQDQADKQWMVRKDAFTKQ